MAADGGFLQRLDPRVKLTGIGALIVAAVAVHRLWALAGILAMGVILALLSHIPIRLLAARVWLAVLAFTGVDCAPAIFLTPGANRLSPARARMAGDATGIAQPRVS